MTGNLTLGETARSLHDALRDYIEATYHISDQRLVDQRRALLEHDGVIRQVPYIESTPRYASGPRFEDLGLPDAATDVLVAASLAEHDGSPLVHNPPFQHQAEALQEVLANRRSVIVTTGTGSGKTECFLLPILGHIAVQARHALETFWSPVVRAILLYPMNALVNDQLGRLRRLLGSETVAEWFTRSAGRPVRFARYTSRTLYPGVRTAKRDQQRLRPLGKYYVATAREAADPMAPGSAKSQTLLNELSRRGKWPSKPDLPGWWGEDGTRWQDRDGRFLRCITLPDDAELLTRHEVLANPPDVLVTNYSMLEYMLMRPLERPVFDATRNWLEANPTETFLVVVDEAHLYRGAAGAEVALLLRRLRDRLGLSAQRLQVICTTASFADAGKTSEFAGLLSGKQPDEFASIAGELALRQDARPGSSDDAAILASVDLASFYEASDDDRLGLVRDVLALRHVIDSDVRTALYSALAEYPPMSLLVNATMQDARPVAEMASLLFPDATPDVAERAATSLVALGSYAREPGRLDGPGLLPSRLHAFFRGLPGLWVCIDPQCTELPSHLQGGSTGRLYGQPTGRCGCGARVFELFTCRHCGTAYCRAYADSVDDPRFLWGSPGEGFASATGLVQQLEPIDLLLGEPVSSTDVRPGEIDLVTGRMDPQRLGARSRRVYMPATANDGDMSRGEFKPCAVCGKTAAFGRSSVQDHLTKGDEPFQALVSRQVEIQQPTEAPTPFAPMAGRKVLVFSDSRQTAARLAPNLQKYTTRDAIRPLLVYGYQALSSDPDLRGLISLEESYVAVLIAMVRLGVRLRPTTRVGDTFGADVTTVRRFVEAGTTDAESKLELVFEFRARNPPEPVLAAINTVINDPYYGLTSLALATIEPKKASVLDGLPPLPPDIEGPDEKRAMLSTWLNEWRGQWLRATSTAWADDEVRPQSGKFPALLRRVLPTSSSHRTFLKDWLPRLLEAYADPVGPNYRLKGSALTLGVGGEWGYCQTCRSTQRPLPRRETLCIRCGETSVSTVDPDVDPVFVARKGYYRRSTVLALREARQPIALVAAEHTAQLNEAQADAVFSEAEENELLFQDVDLGGEKPAIDVLSCTTTMEVGIDIGSLSGVALRNMPPSRANYQQRAGRAGRRGKAIATVTAFASAQSHDEHSFAAPDELIRGRVVDPEMGLDNWQIAKRHLAAFVLQEYLSARLPHDDSAALAANYGVQLFEVLGTVSSFSSPNSVLNRNGFRRWLEAEAYDLAVRAQGWLPSQLPCSEDIDVVLRAVRETAEAVDRAIDWSPESAEEIDTSTGAVADTEDELPSVELPTETGNPTPGVDVSPETLLGRLLYRGVLPRYAFPTDVATFYVFDAEATSRFRPVFRYTPSQGMAVALTQYAPGKRIWIGNREWLSGALYSRIPDERYAAWTERKLYLECGVCHYAVTVGITECERGDSRECPACGATGELGPAQTWLRPPGFAHPWYWAENTSPEDEPPPSYATRAKLTAPAPADASQWQQLNDRVGVHFDRLQLLVTNRGPRDEGYTYCTKCGLIEPAATPHSAIAAGHQKPFPDQREPVCPGGGTARSLVLGTAFISDVLLVALRVSRPLTLRPEYESTKVALRTLCEALTLQASRILGLGTGELQAEFRPALTPAGRSGSEAEIYMYDTLPGGAGFAQRVGGLGLRLFQQTLELLEDCPANCDASCYRCLRSYKNQYEHGLLDRHVAASLLRYLLTSSEPRITQERADASTSLLFDDLDGYGLDDLRLSRGAEIDVQGFGKMVAPILAERRARRPVVVLLHHPFAPNLPLAPEWAGPADYGIDPAVIQVDELVVRRNLPWASAMVLRQLGYTV